MQDMLPLSLVVIPGYEPESRVILAEVFKSPKLASGANLIFLRVRSAYVLGITFCTARILGFSPGFPPSRE